MTLQQAAPRLGRARTAPAQAAQLARYAHWALHHNHQAAEWVVAPRFACRGADRLGGWEKGAEREHALPNGRW